MTEVELIKNGIEIVQWNDQLEEIMEKAARICYRSEPNGSREKFLKRLIKLGHTSILEHCVASVIITCDRGTSHQLVRHRLGTYHQESQRYVDYQKKHIQFICPPQMEVGVYNESCQHPFIHSLITAVDNYATLRSKEYNWKPEDARRVLPNATVTRVFSTFNIRQWRHVFEERALNTHAQADIRGVMNQILDAFSERTYLFDDLKEKQCCMRNGKSQSATTKERLFSRKRLLRLLGGLIRR